MFGVIASVSGSLSGQNVEQTAAGHAAAGAHRRRSSTASASGFEGPQGTATLRNPSDNSLAVGPDHIVQTVNSRMAIFTKKGRRYQETGRVLYGPVNTNNVFRGFGGTCEARNNGDAVVRYDQLAQPLADRHADLRARGGRGPINRRCGPLARRPTKVPIGVAGSAGRSRRSVSTTRTWHPVGTLGTGTGTAGTSGTRRHPQAPGRRVRTRSVTRSAPATIR